MKSYKHTRQKSKKKLNNSTRVLIAFILLLIIFVSFIFIMNDEYLRIDGIEVADTAMLDSDDLEEAIWDIVNKKWLWSIPKTNIFFLPKGFIEDTLRQRHLVMEGVDAKLKDASILEIFVSEREPRYLWCNKSILEKVEEGTIENTVFEEGSVPAVKDSVKIEEEVPGTILNFEEECYFVDGGGFIFKRSPYFSDNVYQKFTHATGITKGNYILGNEENFKKLISLIHAAEARSVQIKKVIFEDFGDMVIVLSGLGGKVLYDGEELRLNMNLEDEKTLRAIELTLADKTFSKKFFEEGKKLEYIDLRFQGKIIYKFDE